MSNFDYEKIAREVINGKWGNGDTRKAMLKKAGYDYGRVQEYVNKLLNGGQTSTSDSPLEVEVDLSKYTSILLKFVGV